MMLRPTDPKEIKGILGNLKIHCAPGDDGVSSGLLRKFHDILCFPIDHLCNLSLTSDTFPSIFKQAIIIPIYKSGDKMTVSNYRPISLLKVLSKVLEKVVNNRLLSYLENHNLISNNQYGFRTKKSTEDAVICLSNIATKHMDQRLKCLAVFLDLKKAFDTVSIPLLLRKMECLSILGTPLAWFKDYLKERSQTVKVLDYTSNTQKVTHGIPQGSTLGPTLFLIYANEMCDLELDNAQIIAFADDTAIIFHGRTWEETRKTAEKGLAKIRKTLENNLLTINAQKTKWICFSITPATQPPTNFTLTLLCKSR
ncbi:jg6941 [Pararge aegeria aegeria]|uniref:Jg6941 protein n=1 Tax=Pararge aegeria aegeria TaxID=348720 RepID=A0A8S4S110_9NEOP|nr:jg6941 [Pararge aegeria aegeria]